MSEIKCLVWNIEWATPASPRGRIIGDIIAKIDPDLICLTEGFENNLPSNGNVIASHPDYGYTQTGKRRKVLLWSKSMWTCIDQVGDPNLPSGRFISGITNGTRVIGVCIPWKDAHVRTGMKNRKPWEDHIQYLERLKILIESYQSAGDTIVIMGDFNQTVPRTRQPETVYQKLNSIIDLNFKLITSEVKDDKQKLLIDHIAVDQSKSGRIEKIYPRWSEGGIRLSDHAGISATLQI